MTARYECPDHDVATQDINKRYQDTALVIFKEQQNRPELRNYLSFGTSRRTMEYTNNGNSTIVVQKPAVPPPNSVIDRQISLKPTAACSIL